MPTSRSMAPSLCDTDTMYSQNREQNTQKRQENECGLCARAWSQETVSGAGSHFPQRSTWTPSRRRSARNRRGMEGWPLSTPSPDTAETHHIWNMRPNRILVFWGLKLYKQYINKHTRFNRNYLSQHRQTNEDELLLWYRNCVCKFIMLRERNHNIWSQTTEAEL